MAIADNTRGLKLSAVELSEMHPGWSDSFIEDYLNKDINISLVAEGADGKMDLVPSAEEGNLAVFDDAGQVIDSGVSIENIKSRAYFYGRVY